jgi:hypothetical protein
VEEDPYITVVKTARGDLKLENYLKKTVMEISRLVADKYSCRAPIIFLLTLFLLTIAVTVVTGSDEIGLAIILVSKILLATLRKTDHDQNSFSAKYTTQY